MVRCSSNRKMEMHITVNHVGVAMVAKQHVDLTRVGHVL
jgi:hypothetical protein